MFVPTVINASGILLVFGIVNVDPKQYCSRGATAVHSLITSFDIEQ